LGKGYESLSVAARKFGPKKLYTKLGDVAGSDDENLNAVIWNPGAWHEYAPATRVGSCGFSMPHIA
jgi:hypothetical protein